MSTYNASRVLPPRVLALVRRYAEGKLIWVPVRERRRIKTAGLPERDSAIRRARAAGASLEVLAKKHHRSIARISEICRGTRSRRSGRRS